MKALKNNPIDSLLERLRADYEAETGFPLAICDAEGSVRSAAPFQTNCRCQSACPERRRQAALETLHWGETVINLCCEDGFALWAVPVLENQKLVGALVTQGVDLEHGSPGLSQRVRQAAARLLELAVSANLLHPAALRVAREEALREQDRFLAIEASKHANVRDDLRSVYLREEPDLLTAIKQGARREAFSILNRILVSIYGLAGQRLDLLKSCVLELVVMMSRAAVEAGADSFTMLGEHYHSLAELASIHDEEDLAAWVRRMLENLIDGIQNNHRFPHSLLLTRATTYMREHLDSPLRRDDVARIAGLSPGHFSKIMSERMGKSFSDLLTHMRVERAKEFLCRTDRGILDIAMECGFCDQSHMNKAFRKFAGRSPGQYRKERKNQP
jgi:AraC-like DNA-binding protein